MKYKYLLVVLLAFFLCATSFAQNDSIQIVHIETIDGNEFLGNIVEEDSLRIVVKTEKLGELRILRSEIKRQDIIHPNKIVNGKLWFTNSQATRYYYSPNGFGLQKGEGYYQNIWVLYNQVVYGVTDHFSIGGGLIPLFLLGAEALPIWITPKVSIPVSEKLHLGAGALVGGIISSYDDEDIGFGIIYGVATYGTRDYNGTFGIGYGYGGGQWAPDPIINLNGMFRIGPRGYIITENYLIPLEGDVTGAISIGGRRIIKKIGLDFSLVIPISAGIGQFIAVPFLGLSIPFGNVPK